MLPLSCQVVADKCVQQMQQAGLLSLRLCPKAKPPPSTEGGKRCAGSKEVRKRYWKRAGQDRSPTVWGGRRAISDRPYGCGGERRMANGERPDRRLGRVEGGERVAAVGERRRCVSTKDIRRAPQQGVPTREVIDLIRRCAPPSPEGKVLVAGDRWGCGGRMGKGGSRPSPTSKWKIENRNWTMENGQWKMENEGRWLFKFSAKRTHSLSIVHYPLSIKKAGHPKMPGF